MYADKRYKMECRIVFNHTRRGGGFFVLRHVCSLCAPPAALVEILVSFDNGHASCCMWFRGIREAEA